MSPVGGGRPENVSRGGQLGLPTARGGEIWAERLFGIAFEPSGMGLAPPTYPKKTFWEIMKTIVFD